VSYLALSTINPLFSPLLGVAIYYLLINFKQQDEIYPNILFFVYLLFVDVAMGQFLFSAIILFFVIYNFLAEDIEKVFRCQKCIVFGYIVVSYLGYYGVNLFLAILLNQNLPTLSDYTPLYLLVDFILVILFL
jgi:hypothetical protein